VSLLYAVPPPDAAFAMPDLTGMTFAEANALVAAAGLKTISVASAPGAAASGPATSGAAMANLAATVVTGQMPAAGSRVTSGTQVSFQTAHL
jgi:beta-lactam-binding protein with PASTA domain